MNFPGANLGLHFYLFAISTALSGLVVHCVRFAISWLAVEKTGSAIVAAAIFGAASFVEIYSRPLLAPLADYFVRLKVYRICMALNVISILALLIAVSAASFSPVLVGALLVLSSLVGALREPTAAGLTPSIVTLDKMIDAQGIRSAISSAIGVMAPLLGGLMLAWGGSSAALSFAMVSAVLGYAASLAIRTLSMVPVSKGGTWGGYLSTWHLQVFDGIRAVYQTRAEFMNAIASALLNAGLFPFFAVGIALWINTELHYDARAMAMAEIAFWGGMFAAGTFLVKQMNMRWGRYMTTVLSCFTLGGCLMLASQFKHIVVISALLAVAGAAFTTFNVNTGALRSVASPTEFRSRMFAGVGFLASCFNPVSTIALGAIVDAISPSVGVAVCGGLIVLSGVVVLINSDARSLFRKPLEEIGGAYSTLYSSAYKQR